MSVSVWSQALALLLVQAAAMVMDNTSANADRKANGFAFGPRSTLSVTALRERFPGYFRTTEEQQEIENNMGIMKGQPTQMTSQRYQTCFSKSKCRPANKGNNNNNILDNNDVLPQPEDPQSPQFFPSLVTTTSSSCPLDLASGKDVTLHACCVSQTSVIQPTTLASADNSSVRYQIAQFPQLNLNQFFQSEVCCQADKCSICTCTQTFVLVMAVVVESSTGGLVNLSLKPVKIPGCCRCLNVF